MATTLRRKKTKPKKKTKANKKKRAKVNKRTKVRKRKKVRKRVKTKKMNIRRKIQAQNGGWINALLMSSLATLANGFLLPKTNGYSLETNQALMQIKGTLKLINQMPLKEGEGACFKLKDPRGFHQDHRQVYKFLNDQTGEVKKKIKEDKTLEAINKMVNEYRDHHVVCKGDLEDLKAALLEYQEPSFYENVKNAIWPINPDLYSEGEVIIRKEENPKTDKEYRAQHQRREKESEKRGDWTPTQAAEKFEQDEKNADDRIEALATRQWQVEKPALATKSPPPVSREERARQIKALTNAAAAQDRQRTPLQDIGRNGRR